MRFTRAYTERQLKFTLPGPMTICDTIADAHYGRRADMAMAFAEILNEEARELEAAGVDVIQFDEPAFNVFMDDVKDWGIDALHRAIEGLRCTTAVHICYGYGIEANIRWKETLGAEWRQYEEIFPALNASRIAQVSLECANSRVPMSLLGLLKDKEILLGAIDVATHRDRDAGAGRGRDPRRARLRRSRAHPAVHQLRHGAVAARGRRRQAQGARRRRGAARATSCAADATDPRRSAGDLQKLRRRPGCRRRQCSCAGRTGPDQPVRAGGGLACELHLFFGLLGGIAHGAATGRDVLAHALDRVAAAERPTS